MDLASPFVLFGQDHLMTLLLILTVAVGVSVWSRRASSQAWQYRIGALIGVLLLVQEGVTIWLHAGYYGRDWSQVLPLHLCGLAVFVTAWSLVARSYLAYEIVYFWAWGGTLQALLTPDLARAFPDPAYIVFFLGHGLVVVGVLYATLVYRYRPQLRSIARSVGALVVALVFIAPINLWLGANYMFLSAKPTGASLMDYLGPWPWYILSLVGVGLASCFVYYLPFLIYDRLQRRRAACDRLAGAD